MRQMMMLLCMTGTLSGPLLRQVEAAGDFGRAHAAHSTTEGVLSMPDGGVGDDTGESTLRMGDSLDVAYASSLYWAQAAELDGAPPSLYQVAIRPDPGGSRGRLERVTRPRFARGRRHAWLQLLLI
jgi:hypothetical protein